MDILDFNIKEAHQALKNKKVSSLELVNKFLDRINKTDKEVSAFIMVDEDSAKDKAKEIDKLIANNQEIPLLAGIPAAIKDNILVKGMPCTAGSKILKNFIASYDATVIRKLKENGVVILGKTNLDEFAMGSSTEYSAFKTTKNPNDLERVPGGSSGGSAAAVAAKESIFALGSDTGGSIRQPASFCGVVGLKPTYGSVSRSGLIAFASSLDQIGPLTKNVSDAEIVFDAIKGLDPLDSTSVKIEEKQTSEIDLKDLKVGFPREYFGEGVDPGVKKIIEQTFKKLEDFGVKVEELSFPHAKYALACYYLISTSEASANLARFDGIRYGYRAPDREDSENDLLNIYMRSKKYGFGEEVKRRIMLGTFALSSGYYDDYYLRAQKVRSLIKNDFDKAFEKVNFVLAPTSPYPAFKIGEKIDDPLKMYLSDIFTVPVNLAGVPALSMPVGEDKGLPIGLQLIGKHFSEPEIFSFAKTIEKITSFN